MITTETTRFILRPFVAEDIRFLNDLHSDALVMRYILGRPRTEAENQDYMKMLLSLEEEYGIGQRLVIRKQDNRPVGRCGMSFFYGYNDKGQPAYQFDPKAIPEEVTATRVVELGYTFLREAWGQGYATEAATAMRDYGLNIQKFPEIHSIILQENQGSIGVAEKIGAVRLGACLCMGNPAWDYVSRL